MEIKSSLLPPDASNGVMMVLEAVVNERTVSLGSGRATWEMANHS